MKHEEKEESEVRRIQYAQPSQEEWDGANFDPSGLSLQSHIFVDWNSGGEQTPSKQAWFSPDSDAIIFPDGKSDVWSAGIAILQAIYSLPSPDMKNPTATMGWEKALKGFGFDRGCNSREKFLSLNGKPAAFKAYLDSLPVEPVATGNEWKRVQQLQGAEHHLNNNARVRNTLIDKRRASGREWELYGDVAPALPTDVALTDDWADGARLGSRPANGRLWVKVTGQAQPDNGNGVARTEEKLQQLLSGKIFANPLGAQYEITEEEWAQTGITNLKADHYVSFPSAANAYYLKPADASLTPPSPAAALAAQLSAQRSANGLLWVKVTGQTKPNNGNGVPQYVARTEEKLQQLLSGKIFANPPGTQYEITEEEWAQIEITDLKAGHYVSFSDYYLKPASLDVPSNLYHLSASQWAALRLQAPRPQHYIKSGDYYFRPSAASQSVTLTQDEWLHAAAGDTAVGDVPVPSQIYGTAGVTPAGIPASNYIAANQFVQINDPLAQPGAQQRISYLIPVESELAVRRVVTQVESDIASYVANNILITEHTNRPTAQAALNAVQALIPA
jgi:hypothetical protein